MCVRKGLQKKRKNIKNSLQSQCNKDQKLKSFLATPLLFFQRQNGFVVNRNLEWESESSVSCLVFAHRLVVRPNCKAKLVQIDYAGTRRQIVYRHGTDFSRPKLFKGKARLANKEPARSGQAILRGRTNMRVEGTLSGTTIGMRRAATRLVLTYCSETQKLRLSFRLH